MVEQSTKNRQSIGFIGLGLLGQPVANRLLAEGFDLLAWNREPNRYDSLIAAGGKIAESPSALADQCEIICLCVLDSSAVNDVVFGPTGIVHAEPKSRTVLDFSTMSPEHAKDIAQRARTFGIDWVDAPVSGGPSAAQIGELTVMIGGSTDAIDKVRTILQSLSRISTHVGNVGAGQAMKALNQALVGSTFVLLAEALELARQLGLDGDVVPSCLSGGMADSVALQRVWPRMMAQDFIPPTGRASQMLKDLLEVESIRLNARLKLPVIEAATKQYQNFVKSGHGNDETVSISRHYTR